MVAGEIRKLVAQLAREIPPDVCGFVSITEVTVSPDLAYANVYVSALDRAGEAVRFLAGEKSELRRRLSKMSSGYRIPELRFEVDTRPEQGGRIEQILAEANMKKEVVQPKRKARKKSL